MRAPASVRRGGCGCTGSPPNSLPGLNSLHGLVLPLPAQWDWPVCLPEVLGLYEDAV